MKNQMQRLIEFGQSPWYDDIGREIINNGYLKNLIQNFGIRGLTSNPSIFCNAIKKSNLYNQKIKKLLAHGTKQEQIYEQVAIDDVADAADLLLPVYKESEGTDGFVSIEVSPLLAFDSQKTIIEAERLFNSLNRPNIMIKVPGTKQCIPAITTLLAKGININVTLLFSLSQYKNVMEAYLEAVNQRLAKSLPIKNLHSVASFFVSRVDTLFDKLLNDRIKEDPSLSTKLKPLLGKFAVINSRLAYLEFEKTFLSDSFLRLEKVGANKQRLLWASTSMKDPKRRDVFYVEELIGPHTVNTMPDVTVQAFADHGVLANTIKKDLEDAQKTTLELEKLGINIEKELDKLQLDGVKKFEESFNEITDAISQILFD